MTYKKYNPTWDGYMGDFLKGNVGINQLKPQHEFFDAIGLEKVLSDNTQYHAILTSAEAASIIEDIGLPCLSNPCDREARASEKNRRNSLSYLFNWTDPISTYAGNIHDSRDFYGIIREFGRLGITATEYVGEHGKRFIKISGHAGLRRIITGTRYGASNPKMLSMGIGQQGLNSNIVKGVKFCIIFSVMYRTIELIFKDEYTLAEFIGNITADMAKVAITAAVTWAAGTMLGAMAVVGGSIIVSAGIVLLVGVAVTIGLDYIDKKYKISEKIIEVIKSQIERKPRSPEVDLQKIFNTWPR